MACNDGDILQEIPVKDIVHLKDFYKDHFTYAPYVFSLLNTSLRWIKSRPSEKLFTFYAPNGEWKSDGTFIAIMQWHSYEVFMFTLDKNCKRLSKAIRETNKIELKTHPVLFFALRNDYVGTVLEILKEKNVSIKSENKTDIWRMSKEDAISLEVECPSDYYIDILRSEHAATINDVWPHKFHGSVNYINTYIELNGGHGVFRRSDDQLVSWVLKNQMGTLGMLQTIDAFKRLGLGLAVTRSLTKEVALDGHDPIATILHNNLASQSLFKKIGYYNFGKCSFIDI